MLLPTDQEIRALHRKYAPTEELFRLVHTHCRIVGEIAEQVVRRAGLPVDPDLVRVGSLVHDIGVYRLYDGEAGLGRAEYVRHGVLGHEVLRSEGFSEVLCRFCSCHTGVGLSRDDVVRQGLPLPVGDYLAESEEERVVMYADKFHSKTDPPAFVSAGSYSAFIARFGEEKAAVFAAMCREYGEPELGSLIDVYGHGLR